MSKITVLGGGGWAIALAMVLNDNGHNVTIWSAVNREVEALKTHRENKISLPGVIIPETVEITNDLKSAVNGAEIIVMAVASSFVRSTSKLLKDLIPNGQIIVDVAKGIEDDTFNTMTEIIEDELPNCDAVALSGPSHAEEVGRKIPTAVVVGATTKETAVKVQDAFSNHYFRVYVSPDRKSIELGGALKNVIALAAGLLGTAMGGHTRTFNGLSGIGDLIVTCDSKHSRNRRAGVLIGQGYSLEEAVKEVNMVVEGAVSAKAALNLSKKYHVDMPITEAVNDVLFNGKKPLDAVNELMNRDNTSEHIDLLWK